VRETAPSGWVETSIGEVCADRVDQSGPSDSHEFTYIDISGIDCDTKCITTPRRVPLPKAPSRARQHVRSKDVLVSKTRPNPNAVAIVPAALDRSIASTGLHVLRAIGVVPELLLYLVQSPAFVRSMVSLVQGVLYPAVRPRDLRDYRFQLPPLPEQRRIVAALEEQLSRIDAGVAALERAKANLERYRASVLKAACEGRLVPTEAELSRAEGRSYEPASELLARILKQRRARWEADQLARMKARGKPPKDDSWKKKYPEPAAPDTSALPELPEGWCWASLLAITELKGGLTKGQKRRPGEIVRRVPYLRVANVQRGFLDLTEMKEIEATEQEIAELRLEPGDVLFNEGGDRDKLGRGWIWAGELPLCVHQNHVFRARVIANAVDPRFLSHYGNSFGQAYFLEQGKQTTNLASINLTKLGALPVPIPPRCEQGRIVAEIERALSTATATGSSIHHGLLRSSRLRQSLLAHAFSGKLVPQDPNDEPASVLLERIRKEREVGEAKKSEKTGRRPAPRARRSKPSGAKKG